MNRALLLPLAFVTAISSQAALIRYELRGVIKTYGADFTFPPGSAFLKNAFPINTPYYVTFTVDTSRGVIVEDTATTRRYNRDAGPNPKFVTEGQFRLGEVGSPLYEGTFHVGTKGSFSLQIDNSPAGDLLHLELFNDTTATKFNLTQVFGADLAPDFRPLGFSLHLPSTNLEALTDLGIPQTLDYTKFTYSDQGVRFFFGGFFPKSDWVGGGLGGSPDGGTITATVVSAASPLSEWRTKYGPDAAISSPDGLPNLIKYALGLPADVAALPGQLPKGELIAVGGQQFLQLSIPRTVRRADVSYVVEVSGDLITWSSGAEHTTVLQDTDSGLIVRDNLPAAGASGRFIRLTVRPNP